LNGCLFLLFYRAKPVMSNEVANRRGGVHHSNYKK